MLTKRQIFYATALCVSSLYTSACATDQQGVRVETVTKVVEVEKPCPGTIPARPAPMAKPLPTDLVALAAALAAKLAEYSAPGKYADKAEAYFETCPPAH